MDHQRETSVKKQVEVVFVIPEERAAPDSSKNHASVPKVESWDHVPKDSSPIGYRSPEIIKPSSRPEKPPRSPQSKALLHRRSFYKPKSRFVEQLLPAGASKSVEDARPPAHDRSSTSPCHGSPNPRASVTLRTPLAAADEEEDDDEEVYKKEQFPESRKRGRRWKIKTLIEWVILILSMGCLAASLTVRRLQGSVIWALDIWKWCLMVTVICCGRLVTQWFIIVLVFLIEMNLFLRQKVLYFVYGLKNSVQVCIWLGLVLLSWSLLFNQGVRRPPKTEKTLDYISRALASLLVGSVIWLVKTLLTKIFAFSFHMNKFFDRIQESIFHQYVLQTLSGPPVMELAEKMGTAKSTGQLSFKSMGKGKGKKREQGVIDISKLHKMKQEKVSAWTMKGLINVIRTSGLTTISNTIENFDEGAEQKDMEITSEREARAAAYQIFENVAKPDCKYIDAKDLLRFLIKEEVYIVLPFFEGAAETGKIEKSALRNWVVKAYLDRKSLAHSLNDTKTAVNQLHKLATALIIVIIIIITLLLMGVATTKVLVFISSQLVLVVFMFGNTCKTAFEAIIFVFVMHPFDVGDRCVVDGVQMIVEEINILTTVFLKFDNAKIYYPNAALATKPICNFYRSPDMGDAVDFSVDVSTSMENIGDLKSRIKEYIENKPNHWHPNHSVVVKDIVNVNKMNMALYVMHTMNYQNMGEKNSRMTDLVLEMKKIFEELSIQYHVLPQDIHLSYTGSTPLPIHVAQSI